MNTKILVQPTPIDMITIAVCASCENRDHLILTVRETNIADLHWIDDNEEYSIQFLDKGFDYTGNFLHTLCILMERERTTFLEKKE